MKLLSRDPKAKQIALDVGITTAKAAIISGKKEDEILPLVQEAIQKANEFNSQRESKHLQTETTGD